MNSFLDLLGTVGGIYNALFAIGAILISVFAQRLWFGQIIGKVYQKDKFLNQIWKQKTLNKKNSKKDKI